MKLHLTIINTEDWGHVKCWKVCSLDEMKEIARGMLKLTPMRSYSLEIYTIGLDGMKQVLFKHLQV
jgi:hypothetical protein